MPFLIAVFLEACVLTMEVPDVEPSMHFLSAFSVVAMATLHHQGLLLLFSLCVHHNAHTASHPPTPQFSTFALRSHCSIPDEAKHKKMQPPSVGEGLPVRNGAGTCGYGLRNFHENTHLFLCMRNSPVMVHFFKKLQIKISFR